jgi:hypothetical protein
LVKGIGPVLAKKLVAEVIQESKFHPQSRVCLHACGK